MKVLYLCYNLIFGSIINEKSKNKYKANDLLSFFNEFEDTTIDEKITDKKARSEFYTETLPNKINERFKQIEENEKYDVIIIDEAQDFNYIQLNTIFSIGKKECKHFIFRDEFQKLYDENMYDNKANQFFRLEFLINYRNPTKILSRVKDEFEFIKNTDVESCKNQIPGKNKNIEFSDNDELKMKLKNEINSLIAESVSPGKIWILAGDNYKENYSFLDEMEITENIFIKYIDNKMQNYDLNSVINLTRPSLVKGLEFKVVMIIDSDNWIPKYDTKDIKLHVYTAITRCTDMLYNFRLKVTV
jgi:superfamily I DNA/RNA helicase